MVRGADAKEANKQEDEAISPESTAPDANRATARKLDDVDTTIGHLDQPQKMHMSIETLGSRSASNASVQVEQSGAVMRPSDPEQSSLADEAKKMRVEDDDMELLTAVHDEPAVPDEPQLPTPPRWDELTGDLLLADLTHLQRRRKCMVSTRSFVFSQRFTNSKFTAHRKATHRDSMSRSQQRRF